MADHVSLAGIRILGAMVILIFCIVMGTSFASADPMFRSNPAHTGVYDDGGERPANILKWDFVTAGRVYSSPAVTDTTVYVGSDDGNIYALDEDSGALIWNYTTGGRVLSSPAVVGGVVYVGSFDENLYALDASTGSKLWNYPTGGWVGTSPTVVDGIVYFGRYMEQPEGEDDILMSMNPGTVYALDAATGSFVWSFQTAGLIESSPAVVDSVVYIGDDDGNLYALDAVTGALIWNVTPGGQIVASPAIVDGTVYIGSFDSKIYALEASDGSEIWNVTLGGNIQSSAAVAGGVVYIGSGGNQVYALDATTGARLWNYTVGNVVYASPSVANGVVYVGSWDGLMYALDAATGELVWSYPIGDVIYSCAAVRDGTVYFGGLDGTVYAIGKGASADFSGVPRNGESPLSVQFSDLSAGQPIRYLYDFGDGTSSVSKDPLHTYLTPGTYTVSLTVLIPVEGNLVTRSISKPAFITVNPSFPPSTRADFTASPRNGIAPLTVGFTDLSEGKAMKYRWDFGDGTGSVSKNPVHTYLSSGSFTVRLTVVMNEGGSLVTRTSEEPGYITITDIEHSE